MEHYTMKTRVTVFFSSILCLAALSGCASKGDIEALRSQIDALQQTTAEALSEAKAARELSYATRSELDAIKRTAQSAEQRAQENDLKINKAFDQSIKK